MAFLSLWTYNEDLKQEGGTSRSVIEEESLAANTPDELKYNTLRCADWMHQTEPAADMDWLEISRFENLNWSWLPRLTRTKAFFFFLQWRCAVCWLYSVLVRVYVCDFCHMHSASLYLYLYLLCIVNCVSDALRNLDSVRFSWKGKWLITTGHIHNRIISLFKHTRLWGAASLSPLNRGVIICRHLVLCRFLFPCCVGL